MPASSPSVPARRTLPGAGKISRFILQAVREATEPVATREVVRCLMAERGQDAIDRQLVRQTMKRVGMAFSRQQAMGTARAIQGAGTVTLWEVAQ